MKAPRFWSLPPVAASAFAALLLLAPGRPASAAPLEQSAQALLQVGREGAGNVSASAAWKELVAAGPEALATLLVQTGKADPVADNWLRLAGNVIVDKAVKSGRPLPLADLETFVRRTGNADAARVLAFDLLAQAEPARAEALERTLTNDPVQSLRRGAVAHLISAAAAKQGEEAKSAYAEALKVVRDEDQTKVVAEALRKLGVAVDLPRHFGFVTKWQVIAPFDNTERKGFDTVFPPEKDLELGKGHPGKGKQVQWQAFESADEYGKLDFNKPFTALKEVTGYALAYFDSAEERDAEIRLGCKNAWKIWVNGGFVFGRDEYHRGQRMDQYKLKCHLKKGRNTILVKCCQNEQTETWTAEWEFQLRVCDSTGTAILPVDPAAAAKTKL